MSYNNLRLLYLLDIFKAKTDHKHRLGVPQLLLALSAMGISAERRSIYRDIASLQKFGIKIRKSGTGYYLEKREFELSELKMLVAAVQTAPFITQKRTDELAKKLISLAAASDACELTASSDIGCIKCQNDELLLTIDIINAAIADRRQLTFSYFKHSTEQSSMMQESVGRFRVNPYAIIYIENILYLVCNPDDCDNIVNFQLDRMQNVFIDAVPWRHFSEVSKYGSVFLSCDHAKNLFCKFGEKTTRITLRCNEDMICEIFHRFGDAVMASRDVNDMFIATVTAEPASGFIAWAAQFGGAVEIVAPESVRCQMKEFLFDSIRKYE